MKFSALALFEEAFSTSSKILDTVELLNSLVTSISRSLSILIDPLKISCPTSISLKADSPVKALVSKDEAPSFTIPSRGTFSPGLTSKTSPTFTSSGRTTSIDTSTI